MPLCNVIGNSRAHCCSPRGEVTGVPGTRAGIGGQDTAARSAGFLRDLGAADHRSAGGQTGRRQPAGPHPAGVGARRDWVVDLGCALRSLGRRCAGKRRSRRVITGPLPALRLSRSPCRAGNRPRLAGVRVEKQRIQRPDPRCSRQLVPQGRGPAGSWPVPLPACGTPFERARRPGQMIVPRRGLVVPAGPGRWHVARAWPGRLEVLHPKVGFGAFPAVLLLVDVAVL